MDSLDVSQFAGSWCNMEASIQELLAELETRGIRLRVEGDRIFCTAPPEILTPGLQHEIRRRKPELLALLGRVVPQRGSPRLSPRTDRSQPAPASFGQERLWLLQQMSPESFAYNIPGAVRLSGPLDHRALENALTAIVDRHEVLRTTLALEGNRLNQIVHPAFTVCLETRSLLHLAEDERPTAISDAVTQLAQQPFDLNRCPYWRCSLFQTGAEEHVLAIVQHHIVSDGWSLGIFMGELGQLYEAYSQGRAPTLPKLPLQYGDYAAWQRELLDANRFDSLLTWWKTSLGNPPPPLDLPTDHPRPLLQTFEGTAEVLVLPNADRQAILEFGQAQGVTPFMTLLAAFAVFLSRYSQQTDLVIGTPVGNRNQKDLESLLGFFLNTLALRIDLSDGPNFTSLVRRVRDVALEAFERHEFPFEKLVEEIQPERDLSRSPVFQVMFIMHNQPTARLDLTDLTLGEVPFESGTSKYDLTLSATLTGERLVLALEYNSALFERASVARMLGLYREVLLRAIADPFRPVAELPILTPPQRRRLIVEWNDTAREYPQDTSLCELIRSQANRTPDAPAVRQGRSAWTYAELQSAADRLASRLVRLGIGRGSRVAIRSDRSLRLAEMLLGVLCSGAAYVPLDGALPWQRRQFIMDDADVQLVVTRRELLEEFRNARCPVLCVDQPDEHDDGTRPAPTRPSASDTAYLIYTSGSTGQPKGVSVAHRSIVNFLQAMQRRPGIATTDRLLAVTSLTFDISILEMFLPWSVGAQVVIADQEALQDGVRLANLIHSENISIMQATPATWAMLLRAGWRGFASLRVLCGGEPMTRDLADQLLDRGAEVWNMYGPTESTVWSSCQRVTRGARPPSIGSAIDNTQLYILDHRLEPVPIGVWGEIFIGGDGLATHYHRLPGQTAAAFLPDPFTVSPGARMYRTGDRARWLANQQIEFLGRLDRQVKVRGHRIELEEIEHALKSDPEVNDAAAKVVGEGESRTIMAWVVPAGTARPGSDQLRQRLSQSLPAYMIPSRIETCDALPLTPSGKVDRRKLETRANERPRLTQSFAAARSPTEQKIARIWQEALAIDRVGLHDNFFDLGGHSLMLAGVRERLCRELQKDISMIDLFRFTTVASLAARFAAPV